MLERGRGLPATRSAPPGSTRHCRRADAPRRHAASTPSNVERAKRPYSSRPAARPALYAYARMSYSGLATAAIAVAASRRRRRRRRRPAHRRRRTTAGRERPAGVPRRARGRDPALVRRGRGERRTTSSIRPSGRWRYASAAERTELARTGHYTRLRPPPRTAQRAPRRRDEGGRRHGLRGARAGSRQQRRSSARTPPRTLARRPAQATPVERAHPGR